jgi:hypothetical protein
MVQKKESKKRKKINKTTIITDNPNQIEEKILKPILICIGEFPLKIVTNEISKKNNQVFLNSIFISRFANNWKISKDNQNHIISLDENIDMHFWHQILPLLNKDNSIIENILKNSIDKNKGVIVLSSLWEGFGSAITPTLISQFKDSFTNSIIFGILPSKIQPSDAHYNAFSAVGLCLSKNFTPIVLIDRDKLESYVGIDNNGLIIKGNQSVNFLLALIKNNASFVQEISELSRAFNVKSYSLLMTSGASINLYGSLENILNVTLLRTLLKFNLSSSSIIYGIFRIPKKMKNKLSKNKIELVLANWFKDKLPLKSILISDPIFIDSNEDRIDLALFVGGLNLTDIFQSINEKIRPIKNSALKNGFIKKKDWEKIVKELIQ